jgi:hypothetical protein
MTRIILTLGLVLGLGGGAYANDDDDYKKVGHKGTVTAYALDSTTVIAHRWCTASGRYSWNYVDCGARLRERVKTRLCIKLGRGTHHYMYQIGDGRPSKTSVYCRD